MSKVGLTLMEVYSLSPYRNVDPVADPVTIHYDFEIYYTAIGESTIIDLKETIINRYPHGIFYGPNDEFIDIFYKNIMNKLFNDKMAGYING